MQVIRVELLYMRARSALALATSANDGTSQRYLSIARQCARRIARERMPWSDPIALLIHASLAYLDGKTELAVRHLDDAVTRFERADMKLYGAVARRRIGAVQPDTAGRALRRQAEE